MVRSAAELAQELTGLDTASRQHLERLLATWGLLADLSFSDLLLHVPTTDFSLARRPAPSSDIDPLFRGFHGLHFVVVGQMRPTTNQTLLPLDQVGQVVAAEQLALVSSSWERGAVSTGDWPFQLDGMATRATCIPVQFKGDVIGVVSRIWSPVLGRRRGGLERAYLGLFDHLARMVSAGLYPFHAEEEIEDPPRVGDGVLVLDKDQRITFASPNAVNAFHRLGIVSTILGARLDAVGVDDGSVASAFARRIPIIGEIERHGDVTVVMNTIPLLDGGGVVGAAVLLRDVSDIRRRDRLLLSKDAAIREVHHRVKNNLQTISSLLRLQSRRTFDPTAREALLEAERRIRAIAVVHEILAGEPGDQIRFEAIVPTLVTLARDADVSDRPMKVTVDGEVGEIDGEVATPLALVLSELLQNAVEHAWSEAAPDEPTITLHLGRDATTLTASVSDNGVGFPEGFDIEATRSLGLAIVRDLVRSQLGGSITIENAGGAVVRLSVPIARA